MNMKKTDDKGDEANLPAIYELFQYKKDYKKSEKEVVLDSEIIEIGKQYS